MYFVDEQVDSIVRAAGWTPNRQIDRTDWIAKLCVAGFDVTQSAYKVIREFGYLRLPLDVSTRYPSGIGCLTFDPTEASDLITIELIENWQQILNTSITPIATISECGVICIDRPGTIYQSIYGSFSKLANGIHESLEEYLIIARRQPEACQ